MATNTDALVRDGMAAFRNGNREEARTLLMKAVEVDQYNEQGWLWLSAVVELVEDQRTCLENVLAINPDNERARKGLKTLVDQQQQQQQSMPYSAPSRAAPPVTLADDDDDDIWPTAPPPATASSVEWAADSGLETSSASSHRAVPEPSASEYDDWVSNLKLPVSSTPQVEAPAPMQSAMPSTYSAFDDDDFMLDGPFSAPQVDDVIDLPPIPVRPAARAPGEVMSPTPRESPSAPRAKNAPADDSLFTDNMATNDPGLFTAFEDAGASNVEELNADELFQYIPADIKPTRLPGTVDRYPVLLVVVLVLFALLNVGAVALLVWRLTS